MCVRACVHACVHVCSAHSHVYIHVLQCYHITITFPALPTFQGEPVSIEVQNNLLRLLGHYGMGIPWKPASSRENTDVKGLLREFVFLMTLAVLPTTVLLVYLAHILQ